MTQNYKHTNHLIHETSPYLLQHANNPVDWHPWGEDALAIARKENKLILVSIGYSACHWCHVMERESFENENMAAKMNENYVCIKVDREERPDIDQIYMEAVQLMTGSGGWPLNCFLLPDGRPVYGGTYFRPNDWQSILESLALNYKTTPNRFEEYAQRLQQGMNQSGFIQIQKPVDFSQEFLNEMVAFWTNRFDNTNGGDGSAPKFPMPNSLQFLQRHAYHTKDKRILNHVNLTLTKMAKGGIYDQLGGGFARYSVDATWKVPHFEKMLYDNAQMVSLYSEAFKLNKNPLYKDVVIETLAFINNELTAPEGGFYSALDADSEGEEGKYYVWSEEEIKQILKEDAFLFIDYYQIEKTGNWEGKNILLVNEDSKEFANRKNINHLEWKAKLRSMKSKLLLERSKRVQPGLDDKILTSWNALMIIGYADAYQAFGEQTFLNKAIGAMNFILDKCTKQYSQLFRTYKNGQAKINAFLDDYSFTIEALLALYRITFDDNWLYRANDMLQYVLDHFYDKETGLFYYTSDEDPKLISRKKELSDSVIPASNSSMAKTLKMASFYFDDLQYEEISRQMLSNITELIKHDARFYTNWCNLMYDFIIGQNEIVISGEKAMDYLSELDKQYLPDIILAGSTRESKLHFLRNRFKAGETTIYVCEKGSCQLPVKTVSEALHMIKA